MISLRSLGYWVLPLALTLSGCDSKKEGGADSADVKKDILYAGIVDGADGITVIEMEKLLGSPVAQSLASNQLFQMLGEQMKEEETGGVKVSDIKRALVSTAMSAEAIEKLEEDPEAAAGNFLAAIEFGKEIDVPTVLKAIDAEVKGEPVKVGEGEMVEGQEPIGGQPSAIGYMNSDGKTVVFAGVKSFVEGALKKGPAVLPASLSEGMKAVPEGASIYSVYEIGENLQPALEKMIAEAEDPSAKMLEGMKGGNFSVVLTEDIGLQIRVNLADNAKAEEAKKMLNEQLTPLLAESQPNPMMPAMNDFKKSVKTSVEGETVTLSATLSKAEIDQIMAIAPMVVQMFMMQGMQEGPAPGAPSAPAPGAGE